MEEVRFIHTADLHLDSPFLGLSHIPKKVFSRIQESTFIAFERVIDAALERAVDFIVVVGDLFDGEDRSIKAQARLRRQLERLNEAEITAFISYGNHDHLAGNWLTLAMPNNVHIFNDQVESVLFTAENGVKVHLYGFSYPERHVFERKVTTYQKKDGADLHIGLLHGQCDGASTLHQPYAPFSIRELLQKEMNYWALGHIHQTQILHTDPFIVYPGNIQGRHRKEAGKKGCYEVKLTVDGSTQLSFIDTADIRWESEQITLEKNTSLTELYSKCEKVMEAKHDVEGQSVLLQITIENAHFLSQPVKQKITNGEFLEMIQDVADAEQVFVWPYDLKLEQQKKKPSLQHNEGFMKMLDETAKNLQTTEAFEESLSSLFAHVYGSRYLTEIERSEKQELVEAAKQLVIDELEVKDV